MRHRKDENEDEIVEALESVGATVTSTSQTGNGFPDIVVGFRNKTYLMEIKNGKYSKLTDKQEKWHKLWQGHVDVVKTPDEALDIILNKE